MSEEANCNSFGTYEEPNTPGEDKNLCHGGRYGLEHFKPCPARDDCRRERDERRGKRHNCNEYGSWEPYGSSASAALCHGGRWEGDSYSQCPVMDACKRDTLSAKNDGRRHLPVMTSRPSTVSSPAGVIAGTPRFQHAAQREVSSYRHAGYGYPQNTGTKAPAQQQQQPTPESFTPRIIDPLLDRDKFGAVVDRLRQVRDKLETTPEGARSVSAGALPVALQTPYAAPMAHGYGMVTPTFLPVRQEDVFPRLFSNIAQGMVGATGHHLLDYARVVDMFGPHR